jgi:hypothetical protein
VEFIMPFAASYPETESVSQSDPTDHALAAIASILDDQPEPPREREKPLVEDKPMIEEKPVVEERPPLAPEMIEADGYHKVGPGPIASIRFKWTVRCDDDGDYYVDETIGDSTPIVSGPLTRDAAIKFVDDSERDARQRFDQLKSEMAGRSAAANLVRKDGGEA